MGPRKTKPKPIAIPIPTPTPRWRFILPTFHVIAIPCVTAFAIFLMQWATQGETLKRHDLIITTTFPQKFDEEAKARQQTRDEFLEKLGKVNDGIANLNSHAAVQDEVNKQISKTLDKISDQLSAKTR